MKKALLFLASAVLILAGCAKEKFSTRIGDGELTTVSFSALLENGNATRAVADNDGMGAYVNRCIMEVYYGDELFTREYAPVDGQKHASFTTQLVSNRTYTVAFWADFVDNPSTKLGLKTDKHYVTDSEAGLNAVEFKGDYMGNNDASDAFAFSGKYTVAQGGSSFTAVLRRPFAQINVITTDVATVAKVTALKPETVALTIKNAVKKYNVLDSTAVAGSEGNLVYEAEVYNWNEDNTECTLSMDYLFAENEKAVIDIDWKAKKEGDTPVAHTFASVPYQRNYRTNIKGALLTTQGQWTVTVDPVWKTPEHEKLVVATTVLDIDGMNTFISSHTTADQIDVLFGKQPNDAGQPGVDEGAHAIVTSGLKENSNLNVNVASDTKTLYVGDFPNQTTITSTIQSAAATVNIIVPSGKKIETLVIDAPYKSVYLNGQLVASTGTLTNVEATTSEHTLVIEAGQQITTLTVHQGGLEIHGAVTNLVVAETAHDNNPVKIRTSENLNADVYAAAQNYIDRPSFVEIANGNNTWNIVPSACLVGPSLQNPTAGYSTLEAAVNAVTEGNKIFLMKDIETSAEILVNKAITLNLNGHNINSGNHSAFQVFGGKLSLEGNGEISGAPANNKEIWIKGSTDAAAVDYSVLNIGADVKVTGSNGYAVMISSNSEKAYGAIINIEGIVDGYYGALYVNGAIQPTTGNVPEITVTGTLLTNDESAAIYAAGYAKYTINDGAVLIGGDAMYICGGATTINGGTFAGIGKASAFEPVTSGYIPTGEAIVIDSREGYAKPLTVSIKGGDFTSENNRPVGSYPVGDETKRFIQGGTYAAPLEELYIDEGYVQVRMPNGKYLVQGKIAAHLNGQDYISIAKALEAFGNITTAGDYDLTIEPGYYRESDLMLIIQNPNVQKKLTIKPVGEPKSVTIMPGDKSNPLAVFVLGAQSDYSGASVTFDGLNIDLTGVPTPASGNLYVFYCAGANSGQVDPIVEALRPGMYDGTNNPRYVHNMTIKNCNIVGNGGVATQVVYGGSGTSGITVEDCVASNFGYFANGYFTDNAQYGWKGLTIRRCVANSEKVFVNRQNGPHTMTLDSCIVSAKHDYVVRFDGGDLIVKKCQFTSLYTGAAADAGILVTRKNDVNATVTDCKFETSAVGTDHIYNISSTHFTLNGKADAVATGSGYNFTAN